MELDPVDQLLERYLGLLHEYTTLRESLSTAQSSMYHHIARANFNAERGLRFGQDHYDERMQASRRVEVTPGSQRSASSRLSIRTLAPGGALDADGDAREKKEEGQTSADPSEDDESVDAGEAQRPNEKSRNPLQWFGLLTPMPLRMAQSEAIKIIEDLVPRLATVSAEMESLEIEVRRARKKRAKASAGKDQVHPDRTPAEISLG
ncbi:uncharacterized protein E0L32_011955 [Thyridium curvatum]|uniref:Vacuolar ATPase assembly protein VMA22 n=1 Tax=Thyridium curvatum TaxID=1093900 RepID=A0A507BGP9_9PEZI|nr:uncharacterized protein E0L32_011955 [Thyridium curvatum]TPX17954.1 hypothetical protein E0L32_011955 [Thyridium curvatum]